MSEHWLETLFDSIQGISRPDGVRLLSRAFADANPPSISGQFLDEAVSRGVDVVEAVTQHHNLRARIADLERELEAWKDRAGRAEHDVALYLPFAKGWLPMMKDRDEDRAAIRALASLGGHQHWDPRGTSGNNCALCMERVRVKEQHAPAIARATQHSCPECGAMTTPDDNRAVCEVCGWASKRATQETGEK